ncbi:uncharacterized protein LOC133805696 [Humulus lupulus]|uniref:uncharacterized protein LOC133805696 n=1 Tax=Humulus lupulus TaxID=3486 RepID=UPI002B40BAD3|nr:uncharacterized protein LOC133805696 [Humulus lupulus]
MSMKESEERYSMINLEEENEGGISYDSVENDGSGVDTRWCLVGHFLTKRIIDFQQMQHMMVAFWRPGRGMYVKELENNLYLFQFYHEVDIRRVIEGSPWTFDRMQLVFECLKEGDNPRQITLNRLDIWVQIHDLQPSLMSERVVKDVGNSVVTFVESDPNNFTGVRRVYLRVRVKLNNDIPIKRRMKIRKSGSDWFWVTFKYEYIPTFCFICGIIGHSKRFCDKLFDTPLEQIVKPYGAWMRVASRRQNKMIGSKWLRSGSSSQASFIDDGHSDGGNRGVNLNMEGGVMSGDLTRLDSRGTGRMEGSGNSGIAGGQNSFMEEENQRLRREGGTRLNQVEDEANIPNIELTINDPKRRRMIEGGVVGPNEDMEGVTGHESNGLSKNVQLAGPGLGARLSQ